jgi:hypothetical protein
MKRTFLAICVSGLLLGGPVFAGGDKGKGEEVKLQDLPTQVQDSLKKEAGNGEIGAIHKMTAKDGRVYYKAEVTKDGKSMDLKVDETGKAVKKHEGSMKEQGTQGSQTEQRSTDPLQQGGQEQAAPGGQEQGAPSGGQEQGAPSGGQEPQGGQGEQGGTQSPQPY